MRPLSVEHRDIWVCGAYGESNFGDDLLAEYVLSLVCGVVDNRRILVTAECGDYLERWFPGIKCTPRSKLTRIIPKTRVKLVFGGGGLFYSFPPAGLKQLYGVRGYSMRRYNMLIPWRLTNRLNMYAFCVGVGPLEGFGAKNLAKSAFSLCDHVSVRDPVSHQTVTNLGIETARLVADPSQLYTRTPHEASSTAHGQVAFVIRHWPRSQLTAGFIESLLEAASFLRMGGREIEFVSFNAGFDAPVIEALNERGENVRCWNPRSKSVEGFAEYISKFDIVLGMRGHSIYFASALGAVPVAVNIEQKLTIAAEKCGHPDLVLELDSTPETIAETVERALMKERKKPDWSRDWHTLEEESRILKDWISG